MATKEEIENLLKIAFNPAHCTVIDESYKHAGHRESSGKGGTHFDIDIVSSVFVGLSRVKRHQAIYKALDHLIAKDNIHAIAIKAHTQDEI